MKSDVRDSVSHSSLDLFFGAANEKFTQNSLWEVLLMTYTINEGGCYINKRQKVFVLLCDAMLLPWGCNVLNETQLNDIFVWGLEPWGV